MNTYRPTEATINLNHLQHNLQALLKLKQSGEFFCPVIKANAYGHGAVAVAQRLEACGVQNVAVSLIEEAVEIRPHFKNNIFILGPFDTAGAHSICEQNFVPIVKSWCELKAIEEAAQKINSHAAMSGARQSLGSRQSSSASPARRHPVHIKFDTGMHRYGFQARDAEVLAQQLSRHPQLELQGLCTHFSCAEDAAQPDGHTAGQLSQFTKLAPYFAPMHSAELTSHQGPTKLYIHCLNSAALKVRTQTGGLCHNKNFVSWAQGLRPGLSLYGVDSPLASSPKVLSGLSSKLSSHTVSNTSQALSSRQPFKTQNFLKPVLQLYSRIVELRRVPVGDKVSYGGRWQAARPSILAVLPLGYGDGVFWAREVFYRQQLRPIVGAICMDCLMVDVSDCQPGACVGDRVEIVGDNLPLNQVALQTGLNPRVILTTLGPRVPRVVI